MKRIRPKQSKPKAKVLSRKRITSKISDTQFILQNTLTSFNETPVKFYGESNDGESYNGDDYDDEDYDGEVYHGKGYDSESYNGESYNGDDYDDEDYHGKGYDGESYDGDDYDDEDYDGEQMKQATKYIQAIVDGEADFEPLSGEYGPYFQNFTEMMFFTWVTKHMISK